MTTPTLVQPKMAQRRQVAWLSLGVVLVCAVAVAALIVAIVSSRSDRSVQAQTVARAPVAQVADRCATDGANLLGALSTVPAETTAGIVHEISPQTRGMLADAAQIAKTAGTPLIPDAPGLAGVLSRINGTDAEAIMNVLPSSTRAAVSSAYPRICS
jgi:hypothetical protein